MTTPALAGRLGKNIAAIEVCANLAMSLLPQVFTWNFRPMLEDLWRWAQSDGSGSDPAYEAIIQVRNWCLFANAEKFYPRGAAEPAEGWLGIWPMPQKGRMVPSIYIRPDLLTSQVRALGHSNLRVVLDDWERRGWLVPGSRRSKKGSPTIMFRRDVKLDRVEMSVIELRPPIEAAETLEAYDSLTATLHGQLQ